MTIGARMSRYFGSPRATSAATVEPVAADLVR
jgi:hypothetical protein